MSSTPRTDQIMKFSFGDDREYVTVEFARKLESELTAITKQRDDAREMVEDLLTENEIASHRLKGLKHPNDNGIMADGEIEVAKLKQQCDELLGILAALLDKVTNIRGIDMELYAPKEIEAAEQVIKKIKEKIP